MANELDDVTVEQPIIDDEEVNEESTEEIETPTLEESETNEEEEEETQDELEEETASEEPEPKIPYGETPKEWALRKEVERLKSQIRQERTDELFVPSDIPKIKTLSPERQRLLEKYDSEQLSELSELIKAQAEEMGFVKKDELNAQTYKETADTLLNEFLENHPEYLPENDKDNVLWNRFREEFSDLKQPNNPKDFKRLFNKVHSSIFGIKTGNLNKINAQQEKLKVASHSGKTVGGVSKKSNVIPNIRLDALKGFDDDEINDLVS